MRKFIKNQLFAVNPQTVTVEAYSAAHFPSKGISLNFLLANIMPEEFLSMREVEDMAAEVTARASSTFVELIASCYPGAVSDNVDCYVVFPYSEPPSEFFSALEKYKQKRRKTDLILWIAPFCLNLHFDKGNMVADAYMTSAFVKAFGGFERALLVAHPVYLPSALRRLWCMFELFLVLKQKKRLDLCFNSEHSANEVKELASNFDEIADYFTSVNTRKCFIKSLQEKNLILKYMEDTIGVENVDFLLSEALRERFVGFVENTLAWLRREADMERDHCRLLFSVSKFYAKRKKYAESRAAMKKALDLCERVFGLISPTTASCYMGMAVLYLKEGENEKAEACAREACEIHESLAQEEGISLKESKDPNIPRLLDVLGSAQMKQATEDKLAEAEVAFHDAIDMWTNIRGEVDIHVAATRENLADLYVMSAFYKEAFEQYSTVMTILTELFDEKDHRLAKVLTKMAKVRREMGNYPKAEHLFRQALSNLRMKFTDNLAVHTACYNLASHLVEANKLGEAEALHRMAIVGWKLTLGQSHPFVGSALCNLASVCKAQGMFREAEDFYKESIKHARSHLPPSDPALAVRLNGLAALYSENEMLQEKAGKLGKEALRIARRSLGEEHAATALYRRNWGDKR